MSREATKQQRGEQLPLPLIQLIGYKYSYCLNRGFIFCVASLVNWAKLIRILSDRHSNLCSIAGPMPVVNLFLIMFFLGHTRLSVRDLRASANQPFLSECKRYVLIYNGEIYNDDKLKQELVLLGHHFVTTSDTEVVLKAFMQWKTGSFKKLNGIFALAIYDQKANKTYLCRDRSGTKPLYYFQNRESFLFSSEIKSFLHAHSFNTGINHQALLSHITLLWPIGDQTLWAGVKKVPKGHYFIIDSDQTFTSRKYVEDSYQISHLNQDEILDQLDQLLLETMGRQLVSDIEVGFFLSGGLDSSTLLSYAHQYKPKQYQCFTIDLSAQAQTEGINNDLPYARKVAHRFNAQLNTIKFSQSELNYLPQVIYHTDFPQADPAAMSTLLISSLAREKGVKVLISGTGGDDTFTGYRRHQAAHFLHYWRHFPQSVKKTLEKICRLFTRTKKSS